ncbi:MAG: ATP-binding cassette domain-containing protein [Erysipelothrix sp.]|nr:ATP-binding cassette domain-containing protein [Erysipelothrix sp.]
MIEIRNLSKSYGSVKVLEDINLKIKPGSFNMIVGGNGAGKSTLVNIVGSLLDRDSGEVILDGKEVSEYSRDERAQKISILKQNNNIDLNITVRDLVGFGRFPYSKGRLNKTDLDIINQSLVSTQTLEYADREISKLSGGQRQRAFLAMILAQKTDVILLDEPLASLDLKHSVDFVNMLKQICLEENKTVVMIVHDLNVAAMAADQIIALKNGKLQACGCVDDVISKDCLYDIFGVEFEVESFGDRNVCFIK